MTTGETVALVAGGIVVVGGGLYLMSRKPMTATSTGLKPVLPQQNAPVGTAVVALGAGLGSLLSGLFTSKAPAATVIQSAPIPSGNVTPAQNIANLQQQGWTGVSGPTTSETDLGISEADYF
jgi:hypothetical protein